MPEGATVPIQTVAIDLEMRPLKGKVEGKNTGKNVLVRSLTGIGEIGATLAGRGNLNQPLSESYLLRERVGNKHRRGRGRADIENCSDTAHRGYDPGRYPDLRRAGADAKTKRAGASQGPVR
jgi:hypothetical protein